MRYGLDRDAFQKLRDSQNNCCKICEKPESEMSRGLHIDHCHATGTVRGLLCFKCNAGLGCVNDSTVILERMISYLNSALAEKAS